MKKLNRRNFVKSAGLGGLGLSLSNPLQVFNINSQYPARDGYKVALMGLNGRGSQLAEAYSANPNVSIAYLCDVDSRAIDKGRSIVEKNGHKPKGVGDFRKALDDKSVDALAIAVPDHWHAPAAILGLKAGKHIYVEKPGSHNPAEGELLAEASAYYGKVVQMGNQRRSWPRVREAIAALHGGEIGKVYFARTWYTNDRPSIGTGKKTAIPSWLDFELWQGPAPRKDYQDNILHYHWHWFWNWGTGEILNNGTHFIDLARWGLQVEFPIKAYSSGGRFQYQDDWETPDTQLATFDFEGGKVIQWEGRSCNTRGINEMGSGVSFHGENGTLELNNNAYKIFDNKGKVVRVAESTTNTVVDQKGPGFNYDKDHVANFISCIDSGKNPHSVYSDTRKSVLLCHLGNISYRIGRSLKCDPKSGKILQDEEAMKFWSRTYEKGWKPTLK